MDEEKIKELLELLQKQLNESYRMNHKLKIAIVLLALSLIANIVFYYVSLFVFI